MPSLAACLPLFVSAAEHSKQAQSSCIYELRACMCMARLGGWGAPTECVRDLWFCCSVVMHPLHIMGVFWCLRSSCCLKVSRVVLGHMHGVQCSMLANRASVGAASAGLECWHNGAPELLLLLLLLPWLPTCGGVGVVLSAYGPGVRSACLAAPVPVVDPARRCDLPCC